MSISCSLAAHPNPKHGSPCTRHSTVQLRANRFLNFDSRDCSLRLQMGHQLCKSLGFYANSGLFKGFSVPGKVAFEVRSENGEDDQKTVIDEAEEARGKSTLPSRFRYLTKEAPDLPVRWSWLLVSIFLIYCWQTVLWELSNWKKAVLAIAQFFMYLSKFILAFIYHFAGDFITGLIRNVETVLYISRSIYSSIVASAPVGELLVIIMLTSAVFAIAESVEPGSVKNQPFILTLSGFIGFLAVTDLLLEPFFWLLALGIFCFSRFVKKRDGVSAVLPVASVLVGVGEPWVRVLAITSYLALAMIQYSKMPEEKRGGEIRSSFGWKPPFVLWVLSLVIGINVGAKWIRYRHLTWMIA